MLKLDDEIARLNLVIPPSLKARMESWRRLQPNLPTVSEAVRTLLEMALEGTPKKGGKHGR